MLIYDTSNKNVLISKEIKIGLVVHIRFERMLDMYQIPFLPLEECTLFSDRNVKAFLSQ